MGGCVDKLPLLKTPGPVARGARWLARATRRMACRKFCGVYRRPDKRQEASVPPETNTAPAFPASTFYTPAEDAYLAPGPPETIHPSRPPSPGEAARLCQLQEILAQMHSDEDYPIVDAAGAEEEDEADDDAPDDVAYPEDYAEGRFLSMVSAAPLPGASGHPPVPGRAAPPDVRTCDSGKVGATGFTPEELDTMDREALRAISRGCKPPSTLAKLVTGLGFAIHGALIPGSEGCVFDSSHPNYPHRVIVKAGWYASTSHEARLLRRLNHPAILPLLDLHVVSGVTCLVLPKYHCDLYTYLSKRPSPLGHLQITAVSRQLLSAIDYVHCEGIIHRDIKTENILINTPENICLGDFGAACFVRGCRSSPFHYGIAGTIDTNAPEVLAGDPYTQVIDIWSAGLVIFETAVHTASLFSAPRDPERRPCDNQIARIIRQAQVHVDEFPTHAESRLTAHYRSRAAGNNRPAWTRPAWTRYYKIHTDVEYLICKALTFDAALRPSAAELLRLPLFHPK